MFSIQKRSLPSTPTIFNVMIKTMKNPVFVKNSSCFIFLLYCLAVSQQDTNHAKDHEGSKFENKLIVPHLIPSNPKELCSVIYEPGLIIVPCQFYFPYQIQGMPQISWNYKWDKFYTVVVLGALEKVPSHQNTTNKELQKQEPIPPENSWLQYVVVNVRKNNLGSGTVIQPYVDIINNEPNGTHNVVYAFSIYEQFKKIDLNLNNEDNSTRMMLRRYFTPMSNFTNSFGGSYVIAGNCFYVVPKQSGIFRDYSPVRYDMKRELMSIMKPDDYVGM